MKLAIQRLDAQAKLPSRAHPGDAGLDLYALEKVVVGPQGGQGVIRTGVALAIPDGNVGLVCDRSSLGKKGLKTLGGVIDAGYRGEVQILVRNLSPEPIEIQAGDRAAQLLILPITLLEPTEASSLDGTARGSGGFGSSGR